MHGLEKAIYAREDTRPAVSEARGEGRERDNLLDILSKPPVARRAGGIYIYIYIDMYIYIYMYIYAYAHIFVFTQWQ